MAQEEFLKGSTEAASNNTTSASNTENNTNKTILIGAGIGIILYLLFK